MTFPRRGLRFLHHAAGCRSTRTKATAAGRSSTPRGPAAGNLVRLSTCSPCRRRSLTTRPVVDRRGPGPRPRGRSSTPRGPAAELVRPSTCSPRRRRSVDAHHGHGRGKILYFPGNARPGCSATTAGRPRGEGGPQTFAVCAGNRTGPARFSRQVSGVGGRYRRPPGMGPLPGLARPGAPVECRFRAPAGFSGCSSSSLYSSSPGQALDVLTTSATIAHHAAGFRSKRTRATATGLPFRHHPTIPILPSSRFPRRGRAGDLPITPPDPAK